MSFYRTKYKNPPEKSFEDWASNRFGKYLYEIYFKPYTEKVWGVSANEISKDWASSRIDLINLWDAIKKALFKLKDTPKTYLDWFYYPREGIGMIAESMANKIKARGNEILTGWKVSEIKYIDDRMESIIISSGQSCMEVKSDIFISTIPITELILLSGLAVPEVIREAVAKLKFRASIYVFLIIDKEKITDDTWLYFPEKEIIFSRLNEPKNWCKESSPSNDKTSLCCQIFCDQNDQTWNAKNEQLAKDCIHTLSQLGLLKEKDVLDHFVERSAYAYPLFQIDYNNHLKVANKFLSQFKNLHLIGRMGAFSYLNMDQVIEAGIEKANELLSNKR